MNPKIATRRVSLLLLLFMLCAVTVLAQTTSFTYQGRLSDGGTVANGNYDLQFALFDTVSGGAQIGATQTSSNVLVSAGIFTVQLDFGAGAFPGAPRFLEIGARLAGTGSFTTLSPRQQITSTPYAIRSLNASSADAVTVNGVPGGSGNYIQNSPASQQAGNFNISGNGTAGSTLSAGVVNSATQYNIGGNRVFVSEGTGNTFAGIDAGIANTGFLNAFFGVGAGQSNTGNTNAFFGAQAGLNNGNGGGNAFFGKSAGFGNRLGSKNTAIGYHANVGEENLTNATAIGAEAQVDQSNALVLGSVAGFNGAGTSVNVGIGTTTPLTTLHVKGSAIIESGGSGGNISLGAPNGETGMTILKAGTSRADLRFDGTTLKLVAAAVTVPPASTNGIAITTTGAVGIGTTTPPAKLTVKGPGTIDILRVENASGLSGLVVRDDRIVAIGVISGLEGTSAHVCYDSVGRLSFCTSSLRYKQQVTPYRVGLDLIRRLRPISFTWKGNGTRDLGLGAEDVAKVEPLLVTHNDKGEIQGVKYDQLNVVLINAIKQQQDQIERQQNLIKQQEARLTGQQQQLASLKRLVCLNHRRASICK